MKFFANVMDLKGRIVGSRNFDSKHILSLTSYKPESKTCAIRTNEGTFRIDKSVDFVDSLWKQDQDNLRELIRESCEAVNKRA